MYHCTGCKQEFEYTIEIGGIDVCPLCGSDMDLNTGTLPDNLKIKLPQSKERKGFSIQEWKKRREEKNAFDERRLIHYQEVYRRQGKAAAEQAYFNYTEKDI